MTSFQRLTKTVLFNPRSATVKKSAAKQIYEGLRKAFEQREGAYLRRMYTGGIDRKNLKNIQQTDKFKAAVDEVEEIMKGNLERRK